MALRLRPLAIADEGEARAAHAELAPEAFSFLLGWDPSCAWAHHLAELDRLCRGESLGRDQVPATFLVADADGELVGRVSIRHALNAHLKAFGGHIGYGVRPQHRRRGHATEMFGQALVAARALGIDRVLVTCADDNTASIAIIEHAGGALAEVAQVPGVGLLRRYWIA